ncbi:MAG: hypothetical protein ACKPCM_16720, partial [Pseudanabaena sp.]
FATEELTGKQESRAFKYQQFDKNSELVVDPESNSSPFSSDSREISDIHNAPESILSPSSTDASSQVDKSSTNDEDMDAIFAEIIAETAAKYASPTPLETSDELDALFQINRSANQSESSNIKTEEHIYTDSQELINSNGNQLDESGVDTLLFGFDHATEVEHVFLDQFNRSNILTTSKASTNTNEENIREQNEVDKVKQESQNGDYAGTDIGAVTIHDGLDFAEPIEVVKELDTILQGFTMTETSDLTSSSDETNFVAIEEYPTVLEDPISNVTLDDEWSDALEALEAQLNQSVAYKSNPEVGELSADEFFASLENNNLNILVNEIESSSLSPNWDSKSSTGASLEYLVSEDDDESDDLLLNEFANTQDQVIENDWDKLIHDLNAVNFSEPLLDDGRKQLGLSSVAPITDSLDNVLDIDSLVVESRSAALVPPPPKKEVYSLDDTWILGIDFGNTALRTSLLNANTGKVY